MRILQEMLTGRLTVRIRSFLNKSLFGKGTDFLYNLLIRLIKHEPLLAAGHQVKISSRFLNKDVLRADPFSGRRSPSEDFLSIFQ